MSAIQKSYIRYEVTPPTQFTRTIDKKKIKNADYQLRMIHAILLENRTLKMGDKSVSLVYQAVLKQLYEDTDKIVKGFEKKYFKWIFFDCIKNYLKRKKWSKISKIYAQKALIENQIKNLTRISEDYKKTLKEKINDKERIIKITEELFNKEKINLSDEEQELNHLVELNRDIKRQNNLVQKWRKQVKLRGNHLKKLVDSKNRDEEINNELQVNVSELINNKFRNEIPVSTTILPNINLDELPPIEEQSLPHETMNDNLIEPPKTRTPPIAIPLTGLVHPQQNTPVAKVQVLNCKESLLNKIDEFNVSNELKEIINILLSNSENNIIKTFIIQNGNWITVKLHNPIGRCTQILNEDQTVEVPGGAILSLGMNPEKEFEFQINKTDTTESIQFKDGFKVWTPVRFVGLKQYRVFEIRIENDETHILTGYKKEEKPWWLKQGIVNQVKKILKLKMMGFNESGDFIAERVKKTTEMIRLWKEGDSILFEGDMKKDEATIATTLNNRKSKGL